MHKHTRPQARRLALIAEAGYYAGTSARTIRRRIADGTLTGYRFGPRMIRVDMDELDWPDPDS